MEARTIRQSRPPHISTPNHTKIHGALTVFVDVPRQQPRVVVDGAAAAKGLSDARQPTLEFVRMQLALAVVPRGAHLQSSSKHEWPRHGETEWRNAHGSSESGLRSHVCLLFRSRACAVPNALGDIILTTTMSYEAQSTSGSSHATASHGSRRAVSASNNHASSAYVSSCDGVSTWSAVRRVVCSLSAMVAMAFSSARQVTMAMRAMPPVR